MRVQAYPEEREKQQGFLNLLIINGHLRKKRIFMKFFLNLAIQILLAVASSDARTCALKNTL